MYRPRLIDPYYPQEVDDVAKNAYEQLAKAINEHGKKNGIPAKKKPKKK